MIRPLAVRDDAASIAASVDLAIARCKGKYL